MARQARTDVEALRAGFQRPPAEYGPLPWWLWTGDLDCEELAWQVQEMRNKGVRQFFIMAYGAQQVDYLSEEWFDRIGFVIERAKALGMRVWIYDEWDWPSAIAGGKVTQRKEFRQRVLLELEERGRGPGSITLDLKLGELKDGRVARILAAPVREGKPDASGSMDVTRKVRLAGGRAVWEAPAGEWILMGLVSFTPAGQAIHGHATDVLNPEAVKYFLQVTHEEYFKRFGKEFGSALPGFFMDECFYLYTQVGDVRTMSTPAVPWTDTLESGLARHGVEDPERYWWAVFHDIGEETLALRARFWNGLSAVYAESLYGVIGRWCEEHGVVLTGHANEAGSPYSMLAIGGTHFPMMAKMQIPGIDWLGGPNLKRRTGSKGLRYVAKLSSSVAHHIGQKRCFAEAPNPLGWTATGSQIKRTTDWLASGGINMFNPAGAMYTNSMHAHSAGPFGYQWPHWGEMGTYFEYVHRLSYLMSQGCHACDVAVYYPMLSACAHFDPKQNPLRRGTVSPEGAFLDDGINAVAYALLEHQVDFDFVYDEALREARVDDGKLLMGDDTYSVLILPPCQFIAADVLLKLKEFVAGGGRVIGMGMLPTRALAITGAAPADDRACRADLEGIFGLDPMTTVGAAQSGGQGDIIRKGNAAFLRVGARAPGEEAEALLLQALDEGLDRDVRVKALEGSAAGLSYNHRQAGDTHAYFFANPGEDAFRAEISLRQVGRAEHWDVETGECRPLAGARSENGRLVFERAFHPGDSLAVVVAPGEAPVATVKVPEAPAKSRSLALPETWGFRIEQDNTFPLPRLMVTSNTLRNVQRYEASFEVESVPGRVALMVDAFDDRGVAPGADYYTTVFINGTEVGPLVFNRTIDHRLREADITAHVRPGLNEVVFQGGSSPYIARPLLASLKLIGHFKLLDAHVEATGSGASAYDARTVRFEKEVRGRLARIGPGEVLTLGSWADQGYPFYSGPGVYTQDVDLAAGFLSAEDVLLKLTDVRDSVALRVNGARVGARLWPLFEFAVGRFLKPGTNRIELKVMNSMSNMMQARQLPSGLLGPVVLEARGGTR
ncbi:MAG: hypothetical protein HY321_17445 [Armatimonadetes bacterium]|nr:hypothetical protein [Armatimonadota bacterium]